MKTHPILFSAPMMQAILAGNKTQTRRIIKPQPVYGGVFWKLHGAMWSHKTMPVVPGHSLATKGPYGARGHLLWVRETWAKYFTDSHAIYRANYEDLELPPGTSWKPSIHMFRKDSRITLAVNSVRVERLQDISEEDAMAEGIVDLGGSRFAHYGALIKNLAGTIMSDLRFTDDTPQGAFALLWESINGRGSWAANPWVWVPEFEPHQCNIDIYLKELAA